MSANLDMVTRLYEGWERGDFAVGVAEFAPDSVLVIDPEIPDAGEFVGREGIRSYMRSFLEAWESLTITAESFTESGDALLAKVKQTGVGKDSGIPVTLDYFHLWRFRDGKVIHLESILSEDRARAALGPRG